MLGFKKVEDERGFIPAICLFIRLLTVFVLSIEARYGKYLFMNKQYSLSLPLSLKTLACLCCLQFSGCASYHAETAKPVPTPPVITAVTPSASTTTKAPTGPLANTAAATTTPTPPQPTAPQPVLPKTTVTVPSVTPAITKPAPVQPTPVKPVPASPMPVKTVAVKSVPADVERVKSETAKSQQKKSESAKPASVVTQPSTEATKPAVEAAKPAAEALTVDLNNLPLSIHGEWTLDLDKSRCTLISAVQRMDDGQGGTKISLRISDDEFLFLTGSDIDPSYADTGITLDTGQHFALETVAQRTNVAFSKQRNALLNAMKKGQALRLTLGFWPTWPVTHTYSVSFPIQHFSTAYAAWESCNSLMQSR